MVEDAAYEAGRGGSGVCVGVGMWVYGAGGRPKMEREKMENSS